LATLLEAKPGKTDVLKLSCASVLAFFARFFGILGPLEALPVAFRRASEQLRG